MIHFKFYLNFLTPNKSGRGNKRLRTSRTFLR